MTGSNVGESVERTLMHREAGEAGAAVARFLERNRQALVDLGWRLRSDRPSLVVTCARGSSDHAATYGKYLIETRLGVPTASAALSTVSLFDAPVTRGEGASTLCIAISQSGRSPDLLAAVHSHREAGALIVALVNAEDSPLAQAADVVLPLSAGPELSVAATKSYIASLAGLAAIVAAWSEDAEMAQALAEMPGQLDAAFRLDWSAAIPDLANASNLFVIGRGYSLAVAQEAALKLKETSGLHGEGFSAAEARHGPMAIVREGFPVLALATDDAAGEDVRALCAEFAGRGARVWLAHPSADKAPPMAGVGYLPTPSIRPELGPLLMASSFYRMVNAVSRARGHDPDSPPYLAKVTRTR